MIDAEEIKFSTKLVFCVFFGFFSIAYVAMVIQERYFPYNPNAGVSILYGETEAYLQKIGK